MFKYHQNTHINRPFNIVLNSGTNKVVFMPKTNKSSIWAQIGPFLCPNYGKWLYHIDYLMDAMALSSSSERPRL